MAERLSDLQAGDTVIIKSGGVSPVMVSRDQVARVHTDKTGEET